VARAGAGDWPGEAVGVRVCVCYVRGSGLQRPCLAAEEAAQVEYDKMSWHSHTQHITCLDDTEIIILGHRPLALYYYSCNTGLHVLPVGLDSTLPC
jgi:hypothetical protein